MRRMTLWLALLAIGALVPMRAHAATVQLSWTASSPTTGITGYRIYYGTTTATYTLNVNAGLATTGTIGGLTVGTTYYMAIKAYNATGDESAFSNEVVVPIVVDPVNTAAPLTVLTMPRMFNR